MHLQSLTHPDAHLRTHSNPFTLENNLSRVNTTNAAKYTRKSPALRVFSPLSTMCVLLFTHNVFAVRSHAATMGQTDWQQHVTAHGHNGKQICAIQRSHSCDTISLSDVISSAERDSEKVMRGCSVDLTVGVCRGKNWTCAQISACC